MGYGMGAYKSKPKKKKKKKVKKSCQKVRKVTQQNKRK